MNHNSLWEQIKNDFKDHVSQTTYSTWIKPVIPIDLKNNQLTLELPSPLHRDYWQAKLSDQLVKYAYDITNVDIVPKFVLKEELQTNYPNNASNNKPNFMQHSRLNSDYTFEKFVIGKGNQMAHAAALVVSDDPGKMYNPLFFYGGVGLGKTHLMQAIGNAIIEHQPNTNVKYVTSEGFTNEFINAIQTKKTEEFRSEYRNVDVLLVDDIQFFASKDSTQEEFFHTFNELYENGKQIVLTSDRLPNEIPKLQDRLVSRFAWGLSVDITPPDLDTRIEILKSKANYDNIRIPDDSLKYIAGQIDSNVRELEGALSRVQAYAKFRQKPISTNLVSEAISGLDVNQTPGEITIDSILEKVASYFNVSIEDLKSKKRYKKIVMPRQVAMYLARSLTDISLPKIGQGFGGKDHTTVIHAYDKVRIGLDKNPDLQDYVADLKSELQR